MCWEAPSKTHPGVREAALSDPATTKRGDLIRSILEGGAYGVLDHLASLRKSGVEASIVVVTGGGARSNLWVQILSDVLGMIVQQISVEDTVHIGNAILAGMAIGIWSEPKDALREIRTPQSVFEPNSECHKLYKEGYGIYSMIYPSLREVFAGQVEFQANPLA